MICYKTHLCYIYSKKKKTSSLCSAWEVLLPSLKIPYPLALCGSAVSLQLGNFKLMLLKPLCLVETQCYIMYPVYVTAGKKSAQALTSACKLYILSFLLCLISIYLTWNDNFHMCFCYGHLAFMLAHEKYNLMRLLFYSYAVFLWTI